jgi:hypothetical protein
LATTKRGIAEILDFKNRRPLESDRAIIPRPDLSNSDIYEFESSHPSQAGGLWNSCSLRRLLTGSREETDMRLGILFYLREHPIAVHVLERRATPEEEALIAKNGAAFACPITSIICVNVANARAAATLDAKRKEIEVRRSYLGNEGSSQRYLLVAIPPSGAASILTVPAISSALR